MTATAPTELRLDPPISPIESATLVCLLTERRRAHAKHGDKSMESCDMFADRRIRILLEEVGEVARVLNERDLGNYPLDSTAAAYLREELIQVGAMTLAWIAVLDGHRLP